MDSINKIDQTIRTIPINKSKSRNKIPISRRKIYSVERPNRLGNNEKTRRATLNFEQNINSLNSSINGENDNDNFKYKSISTNRKNNSLFENKNFNEYNNNSYSNSFLLNNYMKKANDQQLSYEINNIENLYQYYPSYNKSNRFSGNSSFAKINYI